MSALVSLDGSLDWLCLPRPDSPPLFGRLLDSSGGCFRISPAGEYTVAQKYISNTNVLVTHFSLQDGSEFKVTDFCPRFEQYGRVYRPLSVFRIVEPLNGLPVLKVKLHVINGWDKQEVRPSRGNAHLRFELNGDMLRLTTNMPLTFLEEESIFTLSETLYFGLTWNTGLEEDLPSISKAYLEKTISYWRMWVKHCSIPTLFQKEVIRSALALKLHCYEDTGAILAATTTSLPEELGGTRNWDYRFCWLRDAAFVLSAFQNIGHFEEMEGFLKFIVNLLHKEESTPDHLSPVYALDLTRPIPEIEHANWEGFSGARPVRSRNQAGEHIQNDVYGELVLSLAPMFFDERFEHLRTPELEELINRLVTLCARHISQPDAGLWEFREGWQEHSFSNLMCWAGLDRAVKLKQLGFLKDLELTELYQFLDKASQAIKRAVKDGSVRNGPTDPSFDASLCLMPILRYQSEEVRKTVFAIAENLAFDGSSSFLYRYRREDDFGKPQSAFVVCSFWLAQAFAKIGETARARDIIQNTLESANHLGLFSEHYLPAKNLQLGNFPQAYSHVGLINAAFLVSPPWSDVL